MEEVLLLSILLKEEDRGVDRDVVDNKGTTERSGEMPLLVGGQGAPSRNDLPSGVLSLLVSIRVGTIVNKRA